MPSHAVEMKRQEIKKKREYRERTTGTTSRVAKIKERASGARGEEEERLLMTTLMPIAQADHTRKEEPSS